MSILLCINTNLFIPFVFRAGAFVKTLQMKTLLILVLAACSLQVHATEPQADTTKILSEVVITGKRYERFGAGLHSQTILIESQRQFPGILLSDLLAIRTNIFIKSYGAGGLASLSMRGTAPQHTAVYWNGFSINPPNIQMADASLLPLFLFNRIDLVSGGSGTLSGNGAIGGSIMLNSQNGFGRKNLRLAFSASQYSNHLAAAKANYHTGSLSFSTTVWFNKNRNDYRYVNTTKFNRPVERLSNADATQVGFLQEISYKIRNNQFIKSGFWFQEREAGVPPAMTVSKSYARQLDRLVRTYAQWTLEKRKAHYSVKSGYTHDFLNYTDSLISLDSKIRAGNLTTEAEITLQLSSKTQLIAGCIRQLYHAVTNNYIDSANPKRTAIFLLVSHEFSKLNWMMTAGMRKEFTSDFRDIPPALSLGWKGKLSNSLTGRTNASTNYRIPTLNDRYWQPGGNPELKPETGINAELGIDYLFIAEKIRLNISNTLFTGWIRNWIIWFPSDQGYWKPENASRVLLLGYETHLDFSYLTKSITHQVGLGYSLTRSLDGADSYNQIKTAPQLIYTPVHQVSLTYSAKFGKWMLVYSHKFTGSRYTDKLNSNELPAYHTADVSLARTFKIAETELVINASVKNLTNHAYQVIEYRVMPGRTFQISAIFDFNLNKTKNHLN